MQGDLSRRWIKLEKKISLVAKFFLLVVAPILAILLALLGVETLPANPLGWFLLLVGVVYTAGVIIVYAIRKERFWESTLNGVPTQEEHGDRSLWFITLGMLAAFYLSPMDYIYLPAQPATQCLDVLHWCGAGCFGDCAVRLGASRLGEELFRARLSKNRASPGTKRPLSFHPSPGLCRIFLNGVRNQSWLFQPGWIGVCFIVATPQPDLPDESGRTIAYQAFRGGISTIFGCSKANNSGYLVIVRR